jgi:hypothetical protein
VFFDRSLQLNVIGNTDVYKHGELYRIDVVLPPTGSAVITLPFTKVLLGFEEYPNDPHRGVDIPSFPLTVTSLDTNTEVLQVSGPRLLVMTPEPDFSMPFNVICIVGGIFSFLFSAIHSNALWKAKTHWSSPNYEREHIFVEKVRGYIKNFFLLVILGVLIVLDHYGIVKLFG